MPVRAHIRRARRTDFSAVMSLLASTGMPVPPPDRATLRRFRNLVADLGGDFYLALVDGTLAGLVHVTYVRQLTVLPVARLEHLLVAEAYRRCGIGSALLGFARARARDRGCSRLSCVLPSTESPARPFLEKGGLHASGACFAQDLDAGLADVMSADRGEARRG